MLRVILKPRSDLKPREGISLAFHLTCCSHMLPLHRPLEEAFDNGYMCITWEGKKGDDRAQGDYRMLWLGPKELQLHDTKHYPWRNSGDKLPTEQQLQLRE
jgi:hypothetical protein